MKKFSYEEIKKMEKSKKYMALLGIVAVAIVVVFAVSSSGSKSGANSAQVSPTESGGSSLQELIARVPDGIYSATKTYAYHAGTDTIDISVGIKEGLVQNISVSPVGEVDPMSQKFITGVDAALPSLVVGKRIDEVNLPKQISGSSLTTATVNDYLHSIYA